MNLSTIFSNLGIFSLTSGQLIMLLVGIVILFLAINKKFEPLLLLPIGFGAILTNIPEIGLALSPIEKLLYEANSGELAGAISLISIRVYALLYCFARERMIVGKSIGDIRLFLYLATILYGGSDISITVNVL